MSVNGTVCPRVYALLQSDLIGRAIFVILDILVSLVAIAGNSLLLFTIYKTSHLQTISNRYICSMSCADLLAGTVVGPMLLVRGVTFRCTSHDWKETSLEFAFEFCLFLTVIASVFSLCTVHIDRYIAVKWPLRYNTIMTTRTCLWSTIAIWVLSIIIAAQYFFIKEASTAWYWIFEAVIVLFLPMGIILFCFGKILKATRAQLRRSGRCLPAHLPVHQKKPFAFKNRKATVTFAIITLVFLISFTPNFVCTLVYFWTGDYSTTNVVPEYFLWSELFLLVSSSLNPIVYGARSLEFRVALRNRLQALF